MRFICNCAQEWAPGSPVQPEAGNRKQPEAGKREKLE